MSYSPDMDTCQQCGTEYPEDLEFGCPNCKKRFTDFHGFYANTDRIDTFAYKISSDGSIHYCDWDTLIQAIYCSKHIIVTEAFIDEMWELLNDGHEVHLGSKGSENAIAGGGYVIKKIKVAKKLVETENLGTIL